MVGQVENNKNLRCVLYYNAIMAQKLLNNIT